MTTSYDCCTCGACCHGREGTVLVEVSDRKRFRNAGRADLEQGLVPGHFGAAALAARVDGSCVHLTVLGERRECSIYEIRPQGCRDFEVGSPECLAARRDGYRDPPRAGG